MPVLLLLLLLSSCTETLKQAKSEQKKVLLSNFTVPENYNLVYKNRYNAEGEHIGWNDSTYVFQNGKSEIAIIVQYFSKKRIHEDIDERIDNFTEELISDNSSFTIRNKKINRQQSIWYINSTIGSYGDYLYSFYMERKNPKYSIVVKAWDNQLSLKEIDFLYNELSKFEG
ncbi:MAG: hypothetical protein ACO1N9_05375 [Flavobacterium sp.]